MTTTLLAEASPSAAEEMTRLLVDIKKMQDAIDVAISSMEKLKAKISRHHQKEDKALSAMLKSMLGAEEGPIARDRDQILRHFPGETPADTLPAVLEFFGFPAELRPRSDLIVNGKRAVASVGMQERKVFVADDLDEQERCYSLAHELGHVRLHQSEIHAGENNDGHEREADLYAQTFLAPARWLFEQDAWLDLVYKLAKGEDTSPAVCALAKRCKMPAYAMEEHMRRLGILPGKETACASA